MQAERESYTAHLTVETAGGRLKRYFQNSLVSRKMTTRPTKAAKNKTMTANRSLIALLYTYCKQIK